MNNLAFASFHCNRHKGPNVASTYPSGSMAIIPLFHPRNDRWRSHYQFDEAVIRPQTECGEATVSLLRMNDPAPLTVRLSLIAEGIRFPSIITIE